MTTPLVLCARCDRHVRATDASCPFCGQEREPRDLVRAPVGRVAYRAAVVLAGAAALSSIAACEKQPKDNPPATSSGNDPGPVAVYGPPPMMADANGPTPPMPQTGDAGKK